MAASDRQSSGQLEVDWTADYRRGTRLLKLTPQEICEADLEWLQRAFKQSKIGETLDQQIPEVLNGTAQVWRVVGNAEGAVLTKLVAHPQGRELLLWAMSGRGLLRSMEDVRAELVDEAHQVGARWLGTYSARPGMVKRAIEVGLKPVETHCWMEV
jgi:hypothetical protein